MPLAVVGLGCRVRGAAGPDELWKLLRQERDMVGPIPRRWWGDLYDSDPFAKGKMVSQFGSYLDDVQGMDWRFFGVSPREARSIDPQHRLLLEVAWETLEDAGFPVERAAGSRAGVFIGIMLNDYGRVYGRNLHELDGYTTQNNTFAYAANRISFFFDLNGPSMAIDTNCSGSLVAFHQACRSVWTGESEWALAGGVSLILAPDTDVSLSKVTALSPTGRIRTWDARADGFVRGEGAGLVLVKPLASALADRDRIYALVLGTATNHKGRGNWLVEPSSAAQAAAILEASAMAGIDPEELDYVELHGTGTPKGDPIEAEGLGMVMSRRPSSRPCRVGSIKTNFGHLDAAAGVAGLIKTTLCIHRRELVPSLNFEEINPVIELDRLKLRVQATSEPWPATDSPPTAGVTAVGFGGTNVHVVLRGVDSPERTRRRQDPSYVLPLSAKSGAALTSLAERFAAWLAGDGAGVALEDIGYTVATRRSHHQHRLAVAGASHAELARRIGEALQRRARTDAASTPGSVPRLVFVFPGQGSQWLGMTRDLLETTPVFARSMEACDALAYRRNGWSLIEELHATPDRSRLDEPAVLQPILLAVQTSLVTLYRSRGIVPDVVVGHSFGEIAAAVACGALGLEDGMRISCARGRVTQTRSGYGGVAVVELPDEEVRSLIRDYQTLEIVGENSPTTTLVSGGVAELDALVSKLVADAVFARRVNTGYASHSRDMECLLEDFRADMGTVEARPSTARFCSTVYGRFMDGESLTAEYWLRNLRDPVHFAAAVQRAASDGDSIFLEISPHPVLTFPTRQCTEHIPAVRSVLASLRRDQPSLATLDEAQASLYAAGFNPRWEERYAEGRVVSTPTYAWQRQRLWLDPSEAPAAPETARVHPLLGSRVAQDDKTALVWEQTLFGPETAYFRDHCIQDLPSASTSAMVEMMLTAAARTFGTEKLEIVDLELLQAFILPEDRPYRVQTVLVAGDEVTAEVRGRDETRDAGWRTHSRARVRPATAAPELRRHDSPVGEQISREAAYDELARLGIQYGPAFRGIEWLSREGEAVLASVRMPEGLDARPYFFHPAFHDAAMHVAVLADACRAHTGFIPVRMKRIWVASRPNDVLRSHATVVKAGDGIRADIRIENLDGSLVELIEGVELAHLDDALVASDVSAEETSWLYGVDWIERPATQPRSRVTPGDASSNVAPSTAGSWLILADERGVGSAVAAQVVAAGGRATVLTIDALGGGVALGAGTEDVRKEQIVGSVRAAFGGQPLAGVVHLFSLDVPELEGLEPTKLNEAIIQGSDTALSVLRALEEISPEVPTPIWFVTRGAQAWKLESRDMAPLQAPLWGLARAIAAELPARWGGLVDLDPTSPTAESAARLWDFIEQPREGEDEILFRRERTYAGRLKRRPEREQGRPFEVRSDASYLVTGGTGGIGLEVSRWLALRGAKHLVLVARTPLPSRECWTELSPESPFAETVEAIRAIETLGTTVQTVALDVADEPAVIAFLNERERGGYPPFRGVMHLAGTVHMEDALRLDTAALLEAVRPKIHGVLPLHGWFEDLDFFVLFSSAASVIRSPRMAPYAAGNAFLDAVAHYRRAQGQPAVVINWGLWRDVGFIRRLGERGPSAMGGMKSMSPEAGIRILEHLVEGGDVQTVVWPPDWKEWAERYPMFVRTSFIADLLAGSKTDRPESAERTIHFLAAVPGEQRSSAVAAYLVREIAERLRIPTEELPLDLPLERLGFDSLQAVELQARLLADLGVRIPVMRFLGFSSIATIAEEVVERYERAFPSRETPMLESQVRALGSRAEPSVDEVGARDEARQLLRH